MKWALLIVYCALLYLGVTAAANRAAPNHTNLVASRDLPAYYPLTLQDVTGPASLYTTEPIAKGNAVNQRNTAATLNPLATEGQLLAALPVRGFPAVNSGSEAQVCDGAKQVLEKSRVAHVQCGLAQTACIALVEVPQAKAAELVARLAPKNSLSAQAAGRPCS